jgi:hypothetical protein
MIEERECLDGRWGIKTRQRGVDGERERERG